MGKTPKPWLYEGSIWKTEASYWSWLRGQLRKIWKNYPVSTNFKNSQCRKATPEDKVKYHLHPSTKTIGQCYQCKQWFAKSKLEIDHREPAGSCKDYDSAHSFMDSQVMYPPEKMGLICKPCHKIKTHADNRGMGFEEAREDKKRIKFFKQSLPKIKSELRKRGATDEDLRNDKTRQAFYKGMK